MTIQRAEHELVKYEAGNCGVEEVVVPLDGGTDGGRSDNTATFARRDCRGGGCVRHVFPFNMWLAIYVPSFVN